MPAIQRWLSENRPVTATEAEPQQGQVEDAQDAQAHRELHRQTGPIELPPPPEAEGGGQGTVELQRISLLQTPEGRLDIPRQPRGLQGRVDCRAASAARC